MNFIVEIKFVRYVVCCWKGVGYCNLRMYKGWFVIMVYVFYWKFVVWVEVEYKIIVGVFIVVYEVEILVVGLVILRVDVIG